MMDLELGIQQNEDDRYSKHGTEEIDDMVQQNEDDRYSEHETEEIDDTDCRLG